jgi:hypothetical protein
MHDKTFIVNGIWLIIFGPVLLLLTVGFMLQRDIFFSLLWTVMFIGNIILSTTLPRLIGEEYGLRLWEEIKRMLEFEQNRK